MEECGLVAMIGSGRDRSEVNFLATILRKYKLVMVLVSNSEGVW